MFRLPHAGRRWRRPFLALWRRMRRSKKTAGSFVVVALSIVVILNHAARAGYARVSSRLMIRNDQGRKGKIMQKRTTSHAVEATRVWGVEVMDPLEQWAWAQNLWQRLANSASRGPLLLSYAAAAERAALRGLTALARLGREAGWAVHYFTPGRLPVLPQAAPVGPSLMLIHHGSRFLNAAEWMNVTAAAPACRVVLTVPAAEWAALAGAEKFDTVAVPEEEPDYCEHCAQEILAKFFGGGIPVDPALHSLAPVLLEAGSAEVDLPLALLARQARLEGAVLLKKLQASPWRELIWWPETSTGTMTVVLRGRWLAEKMAPSTAAGHYPHLLALLDEIDPQAPAERGFFLNLLTAFRSRKNFTTVASLLRNHYDLFHDAAAQAEPLERQAWGFFHAACLQSAFHR